MTEPIPLNIRKRQATRDRIAAGAATLVAADGLAAPTVERIAAEAEVTGKPLPEKPVTTALGEVAEGKYVSDPVIEEDEA